uniref:Uncharacterized protein n=1 Tax=Musa acuminata subsp. malaccensis TaxID=214687 RepID=A0A804K815_MUSAM
MASTQSTASKDTHHYPHFDELRWVIQIRHTLEEEHDDDVGIPVSVFNVPRCLQVTKPEAYVPQLIAVGSYHHWRPELYEMERYKLAAARRTQKQFHTIKLQHLIEQFTKLEHKIRAHYHRYLDFNGNTLAWLMAVDVSFLLEFLQVYAIQEEEGKGKVLRRLSSRMSHLVDYTGRKSAHNVILRDIMMLENQIPLFLLRNILELQCSSIEVADGTLTKMLTGLLKEISPFKLMENFPCIDVAQHAHLLELLYNVVVPKADDDGDDNEIEEQNDEAAAKEQTYGNSGYVRQLLDAVSKIGSSLNGAPIRFIKSVIVSRLVKFVVQVPRKILTSLPGFSIAKQPDEVEQQGGKAAGRGATATVVASQNAAVEVGLAESKGGRGPFRPDGLQRGEDVVVAEQGGSTAGRHAAIVARWLATVVALQHRRGVVLKWPRSRGGGRGNRRLRQQRDQRLLYFYRITETTTPTDRMAKAATKGRQRWWCG